MYFTVSTYAIVAVNQKESGVQRPVKRRTAYVQKGGYIFSGLTFIEELSCMIDLLWRELYFSPKLTLASVRRVTGCSFSALVQNATGAAACSPLRLEEYD